jgi:hypothetical protein
MLLETAVNAAYNMLHSLQGTNTIKQPCTGIARLVQQKHMHKSTCTAADDNKAPNGRPTSVAAAAR